MPKKNHSQPTPDEQDRARFAELLEAHLPGLRGFLRARATHLVLARESADDLAQSACRDVLEHLDNGRFELRTEAEFKQWLYEAGVLKLQARARFHTADKRDTGREERSLSPAHSSDPGVDPSTSATPSRVAGTEEDRQRVRCAIEALGGRDQAILTLAVLEGRPHAEIAQALGLELAHSRMVLSRAMAKLAAHLQREQ